MTLRGTLVLADEVDLDVGDVRTLAKEVVADQAVEVVWARCPDVGFVVGHLGLCPDRVGERLGNAVGLLERRALGHVDDHLELALVIERQHLDTDPLHRDEAHRTE